MQFTPDSGCLKYSNRTSGAKWPFVKLCIAYWPSNWQAATSEESVVDLVFGVFSSREKATEVLKKSLNSAEWESYADQFVYEDLELDQYHPIPHV